MSGMMREDTGRPASLSVAKLEERLKRQSADTAGLQALYWRIRDAGQPPLF